MPYKMDDRCLRRLFAINSFPLPDTEIVMVGLRGCLPFDIDDAGISNWGQTQRSSLKY